MPKRYIAGFPTTQKMMEEWRAKYEFDAVTSKWYEEVPVGGLPSLPTSDKELPQVGEPEKELPKVGTGQLTSLSAVMRDVADRYKKQQMAKGFESVAGKLEAKGYDPERMRGGLTAGVLEFLERPIATPIESLFQTAVNAAQESRINAQNNLQLLITTGGLAHLKDTDLQKLSTTSGMPLPQLEALRMTQESDEIVLDGFVKGIEAGKMTIAQVPSDLRDEVSNLVNWDKVKIEPTKPTAVEIEQAEITRVTNLLTNFGQRTGTGKVGPENYVSVGYYQQIRAASTIDAPEFDRKFKYLLSEKDKRKVEGLPVFKDLPEEQQIFINKVQARLNRGELEYDDAVSRYPAIAVYLQPPKY